MAHRPSSRPVVRQRTTTLRRQLFLEQLEARHLLSGMSLQEVAGRLGDVKLTGVTVLTHGFQRRNTDGDSLMPLARAIRDRADTENSEAGVAWLLDYDVDAEGGQGSFVFDTQTLSEQPHNVSPPAGEAKGELVLLFDWAAESNELSDGWGEAAGDALFTMLIGLGVVHPFSSSQNDPQLHFIGHSFGATVTSEAVERLVATRVPVDHVTYLDPHDFDQAHLPVDGDQRLYELGRPQFATTGYGPTAWEGVSFVDVYYETRGKNGDSGLFDFMVPRGRPIPGAHNRLIGEGLLPDPAHYSTFDYAGDHSYVWNGFYLASVTQQLSEDTNGNGELDDGEDIDGNGELNFLAPADASLRGQRIVDSGYAFSRIARGKEGDSNSLRATKGVLNFHADEQDHKDSEPSLFADAITKTMPGGDPDFYYNSFSPPATWQPAIINGNFDSPGDEFSNAITDLPVPVPALVLEAFQDIFLSGSNIIPGWSHHGGSGDGRIVKRGSNFVLQLDQEKDSRDRIVSRLSRTHNAFHLPADLTAIDVSVQTSRAMPEDRLILKLGDEVIYSVPLLEVATVSLSDSSTSSSDFALAPAELYVTARALSR